MSRLSGLPMVTLSSAGKRLTDRETRGLEEVRVQQRLSLPTQCELVFSDPPGPLTPAEGLWPGSPLRVTVGEDPPLFCGEVTALEEVYGPAGQRQVRVRGYDLLHRLRKRQPVRAHVQVTVAELAQELVRDLGFRVQADNRGPLRRWLIQHHRSDWQLLADLCAEAGLCLALREETLHLVTLAGIDEQELTLVLGQTLHEARLEVNAEAACRSVHCAGWDPLEIKPHSGRASRPGVGRVAAAEAPPGQVGSTGERQVMGHLVFGDDHAQAVAQAELERRTAYEVALWGVAEGDPRLRPGAPVQVRGVAGLFAGRYVLTAVRHTIDNGHGFLSEISTMPPMPDQGQRWTAAGEDALGGIAMLGVVTAVNDPQGAGRLRATLPGLGGIATDWMHVVFPGAGTGKGLVALPDVEDRVLVLLPQGEAGAGIVLGGLFGMEGPPDVGVEDNHVRRYTFRTPGGQSLVLDDEERRLRLEDETGNIVEMSPGRIWIHAESDIEMEAPGRSVVIRGDRIDFQRG